MAATVQQTVTVHSALFSVGFKRLVRFDRTHASLVCKGERNLGRAGPKEWVLEGGGGGGVAKARLARQLGESGAGFQACSPGKNLNLSLLKWLEMHQKLSTLM